MTQVKGLNSLSLSLVLRSEFLSLSDHAVNFFLAETTLLVGDSDTLRLATRRGRYCQSIKKPRKRSIDLRSLVSSANLHNAVGINLKSDLDLRNTVWCRRDAGEFEFSREVIVLGKRMLTLENLNENSRLVVGGSGDAVAQLIHSQIDSNQNLRLALPCGDDRVTGDQLCEETA